jgi:NAD(P)-dependent dehydrogenase (short-subunit alcohol dehydrogenase family)
MDFTGKNAIVTGGANGIGLACAKALASGGARVTILDLEKENPKAAAAELGGKGIVADVSDRASLEAAFSQVNPLDILVCCAGIARFADVMTTTAEDWDRTIAVNLSGVFHSIQLAANRMKTRRAGSIVVIASTNSYDGEAELTAYNASKAGILGLIHTTANELGPYQIRVNAVCPGLIRTRLTAAHFANTEVVREYFRHIPLGRGGEPQEVANAVAFYASDLASFITGSTLFVDGGQMATKFGTWTERTADLVVDDWKLK